MGLINQEDDKKPLFRVWVNRKKKAKTKPENIKDLVISIRLSSSEEWVLIEGKESVALLKADSKAGQDFWEFATTLEGELKQLLLIPAKGKLGFDVIPGDGKLCTWEFDEDANRVFNNFFTSSGGSGKESPGLKSLTLEAMKPAVPS